MTEFADNYFAGSLLTILVPILLLIAIATWYVVSVRRLAARGRSSGARRWACSL